MLVKKKIKLKSVDLAAFFVSQASLTVSRRQSFKCYFHNCKVSKSTSISLRLFFPGMVDQYKPTFKRKEQETKGILTFSSSYL